MVLLGACFYHLIDGLKLRFEGCREQKRSQIEASDPARGADPGGSGGAAPPTRAMDATGRRSAPSNYVTVGMYSKRRGYYKPTIGKYREYNKQSTIQAGGDNQQENI